MNLPVSDSLKQLLARQGMSGNGAGTPALHVMGWANALLDREEEVEAGHSPTAGEESQPMRISGKGPGMFQPGQVQQGGNSDKQTKGRNLDSGGFAYEVHTNPVMLNTSMRKTAQRRTSAAFLRLVK